jgi:hypothetical protein
VVCCRHHGRTGRRRCAVFHHISLHTTTGDLRGDRWRGGDSGGCAWGHFIGDLGDFRKEWEERIVCILRRVLETENWFHARQSRQGLVDQEAAYSYDAASSFRSLVRESAHIELNRVCCVVPDEGHHAQDEFLDVGIDGGTWNFAFKLVTQQLVVRGTLFHEPLIAQSVGEVIQAFKLYSLTD